MSAGSHRLRSCCLPGGHTQSCVAQPAFHDTHHFTIKRILQYAVFIAGIAGISVSDPPYIIDLTSLGAPATPMPLDILAIRSMYGANMSYHTGNDTYQLFPYTNAILDADGIDTIDASNLSNNVIVDLRQRMFSNSFANNDTAT
jgi:hypothetical protein